MQWPTKDPWPNKPGADFDFKYTYVYESDHYDAIAKKTIVAKNRRAPEAVTQLLLSDTGGPGQLGCCIARSGKLDRAPSRLYRG